jgi:hypothetical protein
VVVRVSPGEIGLGLLIVAFIVAFVSAARSSISRVVTPRVLKLSAFAFFVAYYLFFMRYTVTALTDPGLVVFALVTLTFFVFLGGVAGWSRAGSALAYVLCPLVAFQVWSVLLFDPVEMTLHVTNFIAFLTLGNFSLASNWTVLVVTTSVPLLRLGKML